MVRDDSEAKYSELPASTAARSARLRSTKERRSNRVTPLGATVPPKACASARADMVSATNSWAKCGMTARAVGPRSAPSGSIGTSRQPRTVRPSSAARRATSSTRATRSPASAGRKAMPTEYSPIGGRSKSTLARSRASGTWVRMQAPSPEFGSEPATPRWSRLCRAVRPAATNRRILLPRTSATKATPQASLSFAGSYSPVFAGTAEKGTAVPRDAGTPAAAGAVRSGMSLPSSAATRDLGRGGRAGALGARAGWSEGGEAGGTAESRLPGDDVGPDRPGWVRRGVTDGLSSAGRRWPGSDGVDPARITGGSVGKGTQPQHRPLLHKPELRRVARTGAPRGGVQPARTGHPDSGWR